LNYKKVEPIARYLNKIVNEIPLPDRWSNRTHELRIGTVFLVLCGL